MVAEDFLYDGPVKTLRIGGDFNGYHRYKGGQNGTAGAWDSRWFSQSDGAIMTTLDQYTAPGDPPNPLDVPPEHVGMLEGDAFAANTLLMRNFTLDASEPLNQTLYFGAASRLTSLSTRYLSSTPLGFI